MKRTYKIGRREDGRIDTPIIEFTAYPDGEQRQEILSLSPPASHTNAIATVEALQRAYNEGRGDRESELLQLLDGATGALLAAVRGRLLDVMEEWGAGEFETPDAPQYLALLNADEVNGELYCEARPVYGQPGRKLRVRLLIEDLNAPR